MENNFNALVQSARKGDRHAFATLYSEIYADLYRYACFTLRSTQDAEDAVSEAVADAFATIGRLRDENAFKGWMFCILSCKCKKQLRAYYRHNEIINRESCFAVMELDMGIDLKNAVCTLSDEERMVLSLTVFGGYNSEETAKILKMNRNTVRSKYARALKKLRTALGKDGAQAAFDMI